MHRDAHSRSDRNKLRLNAACIVAWPREDRRSDVRYL